MTAIDWASVKAGDTIWLAESEDWKAQAEALAGYLSIFLGGDDRFQPMIGGNPNAIDAMLADANAALTTFHKAKAEE